MFRKPKTAFERLSAKQKSKRYSRTTSAAKSPKPKALKKIYLKKKLMFYTQCFLGLILAGFVSFILYNGYLLQEASKDRMIQNRNKKEIAIAAEVRKRELEEEELRGRVALNIAEGERLISEKKYKEGIEILFNASTVFPRDMDPQFAFIRACNTACDDHESYCGNAQKRIKHAYKLAKDFHKSEFYKAKVDTLAMEWKRIMKNKKNAN